MFHERCDATAFVHCADEPALLLIADCCSDASPRLLPVSTPCAISSLGTSATTIIKIMWNHEQEKRIVIKQPWCNLRLWPALPALSVSVQFVSNETAVAKLILTALPSNSSGGANLAQSFLARAHHPPHHVWIAIPSHEQSGVAHDHKQETGMQLLDRAMAPTVIQMP